MSSAFQFKHFVIHQDRCAMKIGADAMILGAYADPGGAKAILDIGTGTGVLTLIIAQKIAFEQGRSDFHIDAIDIDKDAAIQSAENSAASPWGKYISVHHQSLEDFIVSNKTQYDFIISNPPYFEDRVEGKGGEVPVISDRRKTARLSNSLSVYELINSANNLLNGNGQFIMIYPAEQKETLLISALKAGLYQKEMLHVKSFPDSNPVRIIFTFSKTPAEITEREFVIYDSPSKYSKEYIELTREFHGKEL